MSERPESYVPGYRQRIQRGVWERIQTYGVLRLWAHCWAALWLFVGLWTLTYVGIKWLVVPVLFWLIGHGALALLTQWNDKFDEMLQAQWRRRYRSRYDAS
jgi:hypothetical protein